MDSSPCQLMQAKLPHVFLSSLSITQELRVNEMSMEGVETRKQGLMSGPDQERGRFLNFTSARLSKLPDLKSQEKFVGVQFQRERDFQIPFHHAGR